MTSGHFIANRDFSLLSDIATDKHIYTRTKLVAVLSCKHLDVHNNSGFSMRNLKRIITNLSRLFSENCTKQSFLGSKLGFTLRSNLSHKNISRMNLGPYSDNTLFIKIL